MEIYSSYSFLWLLSVRFIHVNSFLFVFVFQYCVVFHFMIRPQLILLIFWVNFSVCFEWSSSEHSCTGLFVDIHALLSLSICRTGITRTYTYITLVDTAKYFPGVYTDLTLLTPMYESSSISTSAFVGFGLQFWPFWSGFHSGFLFWF